MQSHFATYKNMLCPFVFVDNDDKKKLFLRPGNILKFRKMNKL